MKRLLQLVSVLGLGLTVVPALLVFTGTLAWEQHTWLMLVGVVLWFGSAPFWMGKGEGEASV